MMRLSSDDMLRLQEAVRMLAAEVRRRVEACYWFQTRYFKPFSTSESALGAGTAEVNEGSVHSNFWPN